MIVGNAIGSHENGRDALNVPRNFWQDMVDIGTVSLICWFVACLGEGCAYFMMQVGHLH